MNGKISKRQTFILLGMNLALFLSHQDMIFSVLDNIKIIENEWQNIYQKCKSLGIRLFFSCQTMSDVRFFLVG